MMKVELSRHNVNYPWTHDLVVLLSLFPQKKISDDYKTFADILSQFAVGTRYGEYLKCPWSDREILEKAKEFVKHIETLWEDPSN